MFLDEDTDEQNSDVIGIIATTLVAFGVFSWLNSISYGALKTEPWDYLKTYKKKY